MDVDDLRLLEAGRKGMICVTPEHVELFREVEAGRDGGDMRRSNGVRRVRGLMRAGCDNGFAALNSEKQLKFESRESDGGTPPKQVAVFTFKGDQFRAYGGYLPRGARQCFVVTEIDEAKKDNKADKAKLAAAAVRLGDCIRASEAKRLDSRVVWTPNRIGDE